MKIYEADGADYANNAQNLDKPATLLLPPRQRQHRAFVPIRHVILNTLAVAAGYLTQSFRYKSSNECVKQQVVGSSFSNSDPRNRVASTAQRGAGRARPSIARLMQTPFLGLTARSPALVCALRSGRKEECY